MTRVAYRTCPLCEAGCGLEITVKPKADGSGEEVTRIRGDMDDVFSHGYICPKGSTLTDLHDDPDRLRTPMIKRDGTHVPATWDEAWAAIEAGLQRVIDAHGRSALSAYVGNPNAHNIGAGLFLRGILKGLGTQNLFSASTVDQRPKEISAGLMFGGFTIPVPDIDRTDFLLCLGANPFASNGSLATAPDWPGRLDALVARGGELIVVDPRRSRTAEAATQWVAIRPGTDAHLLAAIANVLIADGLVDPGNVAGHVSGLDEVCVALEPFTPDAVAAVTGVAADEIRSIARRLAAAPSAVVYGRIGTTTQAFGTTTSWLIDVVNALSGNLDRPGGAMFTKAAAGQANSRGTPGSGRGMKVYRGESRVSGMRGSLGEMPAAVMAEEIETPGDGQIRAMVTIAGNPVLSTPNGPRLDAALATLEFMVSIDIYINETTRHADVILPSPSALQKPHYDLSLLQLALRNVANWSEPVLPLDEGQPDEWEVLAKLSLIIAGLPAADADPSIADDAAYAGLAEHAPDDVVAAVDKTGRRGPARIVDLMLRTGPYEVSLDDLIDNPHGIDFGPLEPRIPECLRTPSGKIELAPAEIMVDLPRLETAMTEAVDPEKPFLLVGRRHLKSNNSWMHNIPVLLKSSKHRCTMQLHPDDAARLGLSEGAPAVVTSRVGQVTVPVEITDGIRPGVVSIPHGWGHGDPGVELRVAQEHAGVNSNVLTDELGVDPISGNAILNGIPVCVTAAI
ncbi:MAG: molybdopterin-dependent oxidoreductase [Acidimicrobiales bacterium]|nr:molybdopterin-dependent oxidoreductase [Acidimicrobiales bacterium]